VREPLEALRMLQRRESVVEAIKVSVEAVRVLIKAVRVSIVIVGELKEAVRV
jgi:hypothetical protein